MNFWVLGIFGDITDEKCHISDPKSHLHTHHNSFLHLKNCLHDTSFNFKIYKKKILDSFTLLIKKSVLSFNENCNKVSYMLFICTVIGNFIIISYMNPKNSLATHKYVFITFPIALADILVCSKTCNMHLCN